MGAKVSKRVTQQIHRRNLRVTDHKDGTPLHCACLAAKYDVTAMIWTQYPTAPAVGTRNLNGNLQFQLLLANQHVKRVTST
mmetsp:Transcript_4059/g.6234  ORF Transcript_4059/g.6234 Transcript_4059/m.6234 type:complete len:81 (-) Transcript_4059:200-442(-)|eukprot:scaffold17308_cov149-Skeletonema_dohrnii-CCMP3373.AAC.2